MGAAQVKGHIENARKTGVLSLQDSKLEKVPRSFAFVFTCQVPTDVEALAQLRTLSLSRNVLVNVPPFLGNLRNLKSLSLDSNRLSK
jgi:Leucine-rich repeat (LRR) protein